MERIPISKLREETRIVLERVRKTGSPVLVTYRGEPIAQILPPPREKPGAWLGAFRGTGRIVGDIVAPAEDESAWEILQQ